MAEILIRENETLDAASSRFKRLVQKEGILSDVRQRSFFLSKSERKRAKSKKARKRQRKVDARNRQFEKDPDFKDESLLQADIRHGWPIDLGLKRNVIETTHACTIIKHTIPGLTGILILKDEDKERYGFPGGDVDPGESPEDAAVRESVEETGFMIRRPGKEDDIVYDVRIGSHRFICFASEVIGGKARLGVEPVDLKLITVKDLKEYAERGGLLPNHARALFKWLERNSACTA